MYKLLNDDSGKILQPENITINLMEHQKTSIYAMKQMEKGNYIVANNINYYGDSMDFQINTNIGILADEVGAGKSLMIITLLNFKEQIPDNNIFWESTQRISIKNLSDPKNKSNTNILIIPQNLINQWADFFKYAPDLKLGKYTNAAEEKDFVLDNYDVILLSCTKADSFFNKFKHLKFNRIIIDEADSIKLPKNLSLLANFVWLVTATPECLRYSGKSYLSNIFKNIIPWVFDYLIVKNDKNYIKESLKLPVPKRMMIPCLTPIEINIIKDVIPKNILTMINAGNSEDAIKLLNCNVDTQDNILKVITANIQEAIRIKRVELKLENDLVSKTTNPKIIEEHLEKIKRIEKCIGRLETRYNSIKEKVYTLNDKYCPICLDAINKPALVNCCQSVYCFECLSYSLSKSNKCPHCAKVVHKQDLHILDNKLNNDSKVNNNVKELKDKLEILLEIIKDNPTGKFLVFANFPQTFSKIENELTNSNIKYEIIKGTNNKIDKVLDNFKNNNTQILMLNAKYFGQGMNLQMASHVILYHRFDRELEEQIIGRAQRLGRTEPLNIVYLIHDNETKALTHEYDDLE